MSLQNTLYLFLCLCVTFYVQNSSCKLMATWEGDHLRQDSKHTVSELGRGSTWKKPKIRVFLSPTFTSHEKSILRAAFEEIRQKTCVNFDEEKFVPWYHWMRWEVSHIVFRPSNRVNLMAEAKMDDAFNRTLMYISRETLNQENQDLARGMVLHELSRVLGLKHENDRSEAAKYLTMESSSKSRSNGKGEFRIRRQRDSPETHRWPFDPTSVTIFEPYVSSKFGYRLTSHCKGVADSDIAKGMRIGRLTFWDAVKIDSLYCPEEVPDEAFHTPGPCDTAGKWRVALARTVKRVAKRRRRLRKVVRHF